jgi:hypothetical protein
MDAHFANKGPTIDALNLERAFLRWLIRVGTAEGTYLKE